MRLATHSVDGSARTGRVVGDEIIGLCDPAVGLPTSMVESVALGDQGSTDG